MQRTRAPPMHVPCIGNSHLFPPWLRMTAVWRQVGVGASPGIRWFGASLLEPLQRRAHRPWGSSWQ